MRRIALVAILLVSVSMLAVIGTGADDGDSGGDYKVRAIFDNAVSVIPGEDVKIAGVKVGRIDSLDITNNEKAAVVLSITALQKSQPVVQFIRPYTPEFVGWLRDFGQGASAYDANGHYARIQPIFNATSPNSLIPVPIATGDRFAGLQQGNLQRCPGAASQYPTDGSAPFLDGGSLDCQPSEVPPGP